MFFASFSLSLQITRLKCIIGYCSHQNVHEKVKYVLKWRVTMEVFPNVFSLARDLKET